MVAVVLKHKCQQCLIAGAIKYMLFSFSFYGQLARKYIAIVAFTEIAQILILRHQEHAHSNFQLRCKYNISLN
jgi:hypothetical protein